MSTEPLFYFVEKHKGKICKRVKIWKKTLPEAKQVAEQMRDYSSSVISILCAFGDGCYARKEGQKDWVDDRSRTSFLEAQPRTTFLEGWGDGYEPGKGEGPTKEHQ